MDFFVKILLFLHFLDIVFADFNASYLTAYGLGKLVYEFNYSRILIGRCVRLNVFLNLFLKRIRFLGSLNKNDSCIYYLTANLIGNGTSFPAAKIRLSTIPTMLTIIP